MRKELRKLGREYRKEFDAAMRKVGRPIANQAKLNYRKLHPRRRGGKGSQRGIRSTFSGGAATVLLGSDKYHYLLGQEWGSNRYPQFPPSLPTGWGGSQGNFFWPAIEEGRDQLYEDLLAAVDKANRRAFPEPGGRR